MCLSGSSAAVASFRFFAAGSSFLFDNASCHEAYVRCLLLRVWLRRLRRILSWARHRHSSLPAAFDDGLPFGRGDQAFPLRLLAGEFASPPDGFGLFSHSFL
nr:hypothetical protein SHINE37_41124 [Rhizobiaceae bacterium]